MTLLQEAEDAIDAAEERREIIVVELVTAFRDDGARGLHLVVALNNLCAAQDDFDQAIKHWFDLNATTDIDQRSDGHAGISANELEQALDRRKIVDEIYRECAPVEGHSDIPGHNGEVPAAGNHDRNARASSSPFIDTRFDTYDEDSEPARVVSWREGVPSTVCHESPEGLIVGERYTGDPAAYAPAYGLLADPAEMPDAPWLTAGEIMVFYASNDSIWLEDASDDDVFGDQRGTMCAWVPPGCWPEWML